MGLIFAVVILPMRGPNQARLLRVRVRVGNLTTGSGPPLGSTARAGLSLCHRPAVAATGSEWQAPGSALAIELLKYD
jgi:hypothetical protein